MKIVQRFRYRKVTPEMAKRMPELREEGMSLEKIGNIFGLDSKTVKYWVDEDYRRLHSQKMKERYKKKAHKLTKKQRQKKKDYMREYMMDRYDTDPAFRKTMLEANKKYLEKKKFTFQ